MFAFSHRRRPRPNRNTRISWSGRAHAVIQDVAIIGVLVFCAYIAAYIGGAHRSRLNDQRQIACPGILHVPDSAGSDVKALRAKYDCPYVPRDIGTHRPAAAGSTRPGPSISARPAPVLPRTSSVASVTRSASRAPRHTPSSQRPTTTVPSAPRGTSPTAPRQPASPATSTAPRGLLPIVCTALPAPLLCQ